MFSKITDALITAPFKVFLVIFIVIFTFVMAVSTAIISVNTAGLARMADRIKDEGDKSGYISTAYIREVLQPYVLGPESTQDLTSKGAIYGQSSPGNGGTVAIKDIKSSSDIQGAIDSIVQESRGTNGSSPSKKIGMLIVMPKGGNSSDGYRIPYGEKIEFTLFRTVRTPLSVITKWNDYLLGHNQKPTYHVIKVGRTFINRGSVDMKSNSNSNSREKYGYDDMRSRGIIDGTVDDMKNLR